jgi:signal transduction histidine kinase
MLSETRLRAECVREQRLLTDADRLRRLQALTDAALSSLELDELLAVILDRTRSALDADTCAILLLDEDANELVARAAVGIEEEVERGVRIPVGRGFAGRVAADRRAVILDDVDHADVLNPILREKGIKSLLGVPLLARGEAIGVLHVGTLTHRIFSAEEAELLRLAAERAALGIEHARLFEAERLARRRIEHVQAITDEALAHLDLDELLDELLPRIREILAADTCALLLLDAETNDLVVRAALGLEEAAERRIRIPLGRGFAGRIAADRRPVILADAARADIVNPILREKEVKSLLGVPLLARGQVIGVLHVGTLEPRRFGRDAVDLLSLVGERVALAVERARVHEQALQLDELKSNFVAIASHEVRTPASAIYGVFATLARRNDLSAATRDELIHVGFGQADRLRRLIEQLLDLSRVDARSVSIEPKRLLVRDALADIVAGAVPDGTDVRIDVPDDLAAVIDPVILERVVSNLLTNATRYGAPPIVISAENGDTDVWFAVEDAGAGIPQDFAGQLFERFSRGDDARGSGLGLAIARAYARAHGGDLVLTPRTSGARFEFAVPQGNAPAARHR